jgi:phosphate transport system substrate-binding protein
MALRYRVLLAAAAAVPLVLVTGCGGGGAAGSAAVPTGALAATGGGIPAGPAPGPQSISETGSTLLAPLMGTWADAYHQQHPNVTISTGGTGSKAGIADAAAGKVNIGASDAYLSSGTLVQHQGLLNIPLAVSAQQINYNLPGVANLKLNGKILADMYQGSITTWNNAKIAALNPGVHLPGIRVVPVHRSDGSGDTFLFTSYLSTHDSVWNHNIGYGTTVAWPAVAGARTAMGNKGMLAACQATRGCVAYIGIAYLSQATAAGLGEARLQNTIGQYVQPDQVSIDAAVQSFVSVTPANETISMVNGPAGNGYPIVNYEYAIVSTKQPSAAKARDIKAFLHWAITLGNSARYLTTVQFQPLPQPIVSLSDAQIAKIG